MFFEYPKLLWLLLLVPLAILIYVWREITGRHPYITVSTITPWQEGKDGWFKRIARHFPFVLRCIALAALILAMLAGRIVWGAAQYFFLGINDTVFTVDMFIAGAFLNAVPGIILHIALIPPIVMMLGKAGLNLNGTR